MTPADGLNNCALRLALSQKYGWRWISSWRPTIWPVTGWAPAFISDTLALSAPPDERLCFYRIDSPDAVRTISLFYKRTRALTAPCAPC